MPSYEVLSPPGSDPKTVKGEKQGYLTGILYLAPSTEADGVHNLCPFATKSTPDHVGCADVCLYGQGMAQVFPSIKRARIAKTLFFLQRQQEFVRALENDIRTLIKEASQRGLTPCVRINGTSDLPKLARLMASRFPEVQFYDYTKIPRPWKRTLANYHLTFSHSGENLSDCLQALAHGINVAVVFSGKNLPDFWNGYRVVDGDTSDLRFLDERGVIVGLKAKGTARKAAVGGFIQIGA